MRPIEEYIRQQGRPSGPYVMHQQWRSLLFVHFAFDPDLIRPLIPASLELDIFEGEAWVGLVFFRMQGIRGRGLPMFPGHGAFPETNVRTYVSHPARGPGVWFHSLDAASEVGCRFARRFWGLPYHRAEMSVQETEDSVEYCSRRLATGASTHAIAQLGQPRKAPVPGSLDFFLVERYRLYAQCGPRLLSARVHHVPYPLREATCEELQEDLLGDLGIPSGPVRSVLFSPGVDTRIWPIMPVRQ